MQYNDEPYKSVHIARVSRCLSRWMAAVLMAAVCAVSFGSAAAAQDVEELRRLIAEATRLAVEGKYDDAITKYFEAKTVLDDPRLDYNIARCYQQKGDCQTAKRVYLLVSKNENSDLEDKKQAEKYLAELGECKIVADPKTEQAKQTPPTEDPTQETGSDRENDAGKSLTYAAWGTTITGGALLLTGFGLDVISGGLADELEAAASSNDRPRFDRTRETIEGRQTTLLVLYIVGALATSAGVALFFLDEPAESATGTQSDAEQEATWKVEPWVSPSEAGLWFQGRF